MKNKITGTDDYNKKQQQKQTRFTAVTRKQPRCQICGRNLQLTAPASGPFPFASLLHVLNQMVKCESGQIIRALGNATSQN